MKLYRLVVLSCLLVFGLSGCANQPVKVVPKKLKTQGLLVGQFASMSDFQDYFLNGAHLRIDGKRYRWAVSDDRFVVPLKPGQHRLDSVYLVRTTGNIVRTTSYPIKHDFEIRAGEVTNLGMILFAKADRNSKKFFRLHVDNDTDMQELLKNQYAESYAMLKDTSTKTDIEKLIPLEKLDPLRRMAVDWSRFSYASQSDLRSGALGTLGRIEKLARGKTKISMFNTGTIQHIFFCSDNDKKIVCIVDAAGGNKILIIEGNKSKLIPVSPQLTMRRIFAAKNGEIVAADWNFHTITSLDNGQSWVEDKNHEITKFPKERWDMKYQDGRNGIYLYGTGKGTPLLYRPYGQTRFQRIETPGISKIKNVVETKQGLYVGPKFTKLGNAALLFRANGSTDWIRRTIPQSHCTGLEQKGKFLIAHCSKVKSPSVLASKDQGKTWKLIARKSLP